MRSLKNQLGDPSLHLLAIALIVVYLALGRGFAWQDTRAEAPLPTCKVCQGRYFPGTTCDCRYAADIAHASP